MAAGWSQVESSLPPDNGGGEGFLQRGSSVTAGRTVMGTAGDPVALLRATALGSQETLWAIEHPMASAIASTDEVDQYLAWFGGRAGMGPACDGGSPDEFWELLQRQQRVAVHLAHAHSMGDRRWVLELLRVSHELGQAMGRVWEQG
ncbi:hypothetical protein JB92DRAFT_3130475 [Gautieria morchelliformis]|nr:hypothetical protein JB92DRAFT_3130475 [Gautieria morchelliformis]